MNYSVCQNFNRYWKGLNLLLAVLCFCFNSEIIGEFLIHIFHKISKPLYQAEL